MNEIKAHKVLSAAVICYYMLLLCVIICYYMLLLCAAAHKG